MKIFELLPAAGRLTFTYRSERLVKTLTEVVEMLHFFMQRFITFKFANPLLFLNVCCGYKPPVLFVTNEMPAAEHLRQWGYWQSEVFPCCIKFSEASNYYS